MLDTVVQITIKTIDSILYSLAYKVGWILLKCNFEGLNWKENLIRNRKPSLPSLFIPRRRKGKTFYFILFKELNLLKAFILLCMTPHRFNLKKDS